MIQRTSSMGDLSDTARQDLDIGNLMNEVNRINGAVTQVNDSLKKLSTLSFTIGASDYLTNSGFYSRIARKYWQHGLGYQPIVIAMVNDTTNYHPIPYNTFDSSNGTYTGTVEVFADDTRVWIQASAHDITPDYYGYILVTSMPTTTTSQLT